MTWLKSQQVYAESIYNNTENCYVVVFATASHNRETSATNTTVNANKQHEVSEA